MAEISLAIGTSHAPQLGTPPEQWGERARADRGNPALVYQGKEYPYGALRDLRQAAFAGDCELDVWRRRHAASRAAIAALGKAVHEAALDVLVIVSSDHKEVFRDELLPQFAVYWGDSVAHVPLTQAALDAFPPGLAIAEVENYPEVATTRACQPDLAVHLIKETSKAGFDPSASRELPAGAYDDHGIPHGWGFIVQQVLGGHDVPAIVPVFVNTFYEPNPPGAARCYEFGRALGEAIRSFPGNLRVGVVASGGLSHFVIDEDLDRGFLAGAPRQGRWLHDRARRRCAALGHLGVPQLDRGGRRPRGGAALRPGHRLPALLPVGGGDGLRHGLRPVGPACAVGLTP